MEVIAITFKLNNFKILKILYNGTYSLAKVELHNAKVSLNMNVLIH